MTISRTVEVAELEMPSIVGRRPTKWTMYPVFRGNAVNLHAGSRPAFDCSETLSSGESHTASRLFNTVSSLRLQTKCSRYATPDVWNAFDKKTATRNRGDCDAGVKVPRFNLESGNSGRKATVTNFYYWPERVMAVRSPFKLPSQIIIAMPLRQTAGYNINALRGRDIQSSGLETNGDERRGSSRPVASSLLILERCGVESRHANGEVLETDKTGGAHPVNPHRSASRVSVRPSLHLILWQRKNPTTKRGGYLKIPEGMFVTSRNLGGLALATTRSHRLSAFPNRHRCLPVNRKFSTN